MGPIEDGERRCGDKLLEAAMLREAAVIEREWNVRPDAERCSERPRGPWGGSRAWRAVVDHDDPARQVARAELPGKRVVDGHERIRLADPGRLPPAEDAARPARPRCVGARFQEDLVTVVDERPAGPGTREDGRVERVEIVAVEDIRARSGRGGGAIPLLR